MIIVVYTVLCCVVAIFGFIFCACEISSKYDRKEEENEENNFITDIDIDNEFWNDK